MLIPTTSAGQNSWTCSGSFGTFVYTGAADILINPALEFHVSDILIFSERLGDHNLIPYPDVMRKVQEGMRV